MAKKKDPQAKAKQQKIILAVGSVLLVALLALEGPKTLKQLNGKPPADESHAVATTPSTTSTTSSVVGTAPAGPGGIATATPATTPTAAPTAQTAAVVVPDGIGIANTTVPAAAGAGQLVAFSHFKSKDPFVQQVSAEASSSSSPTPTPPATPSSTPATTASPSPATTPAGGSSVVPAQTAPATTPGTTSVPVAPAPAAQPAGAKIVVDGTTEDVAVKASFPKASPTFTLVSVTKTTARIGIVGGSYSSGGATITLRLGKTVTLMNTADGARYKLRLVAVG